MRVCYEKATKRIIEIQSGGDTPDHLQTLIDNAVRAGWSQDTITCEFMDAAQYAAAQLADPYLQAEVKAAKDKEDKITKAKAELKALIAVMDPDPTKVKLEEVVAHLIQIEIILGLR